jgi:hypothetical protein
MLAELITRTLLGSQQSRLQVVEGLLLQCLGVLQLLYQLHFNLFHAHDLVFNAASFGFLLNHSHLIILTILSFTGLEESCYFLVTVSFKLTDAHCFHFVPEFVLFDHVSFNTVVHH